MGSIVEPKMKRAAEYEPLMLRSFSQFNSLCRNSAAGTISTADLRMLLTKHGDAIDDASFDVLLRAMGDSRKGDVVDFSSLVSKVVQSST
jgi:Ca2+-binding EF-hand superfamily protein